MSLHHIAQHLKDQGRGPDDMLVHMSHGEVKALQSLAKAHGGSLTINPHTGLPEAGFLSSMLPVALGAAGMAMGIPTPMLVGGIALADYAITGSLKQGLMAGLGAWSGSSMAGSLANAGAEEAAQEATKNAAEGLAPAVTTAAPPPAPVVTPGGPSVPVPGVDAMNNAATVAEDAAGYGGTTNGVPNQVEGTKAFNPNPTEAAKNEALRENMLRGASSLSGWTSAISANPGAALGVVAPALYGALNNKPTVPGSTAQKNPFGLKTIPRDENGNPIFNASLPTPPNPAYKPVYPNYQTNPYTPVGAAEGGVMKMAVGGSAPMIGTPAQNTTMDSSVGNNTMFPMSEMARSYYATPTQLPAGINAQNNPNPAGQSNAPQIPGYGPKLDTNTGQMINNFAIGGQVKGYATGGQLEVNGSINVNNGNGIGNEVVGANGYTPAGGQPWGGGQYSGQTTAQQAPSTYGQGQPTPSQSPFGTFLQPGQEDFGNPKYQTNSTQPIGSALGNLMNGGRFGSGLGGGITGGFTEEQVARMPSVNAQAQGGMNPLFGSPNIQYADPAQPQGMGSRAFTASNESMGGLKALLGGNTSAPQSQSLTPQFAQGGIAQYAGDKYGSMIKGYEDMQSGLETATKRKMLDTPTPDVGIYTPDSETRGMDSLDATMHYLNKNMAVLPKGSNTIKKTGSLGAISHTPAAQAAQETAAAQKAKESIAKESNPSEAKEGGVIGMAFGGMSNMTQTADPSIAESKTRPNGFLSGLVWDSIHPQNQYSNKSVRTFTGSQPSMQSNIYQPSYTNYAQSPYQAQPMLNPAQLQAASQAYLNQGIPTPTRTMAAGGLSMGGHLGNYSDGGHLLKGPGDGVSDSIPATIGGKQPARLAEGEFVIPARIVSELGNGSTDAGAKRLYAMMDRIKAKRRKTKNIAADTKAYKYLPA